MNAELEVVSRSAEETFELGLRAGSLLDGGEVLALAGELGSGKTTFVRGLAAGLGCSPGDVSSPTYVLEQVYEGRIPLHHYDAYRLGSDREFEDLGFEETIARRRIAAIEWADRVAAVLPDERMLVEFRFDGDPSSGRRRIRLSGPQETWSGFLRELVRGMTDRLCGPGTGSGSGTGTGWPGE